MQGYFDNTSIIRRIHRERAVALSGPRALLMQAAHPLAVWGLLAHSSALEQALAPPEPAVAGSSLRSKMNVDRAHPAVRAAQSVTTLAPGAGTRHR